MLLSRFLVTPRPLPQRSNVRPLRRRCTHRSILDKTGATASTATATANSTEPSTPSPSPEPATGPRPRPTSPEEPPKAKLHAKPNAASNAT